MSVFGSWCFCYCVLFCWIDLWFFWFDWFCFCCGCCVLVYCGVVVYFV